jgi:uncharacterized membrane protein
MKTANVYSWTIALLGLFAGGCITILFILVPFWFRLPPDNLMQWFTDFGPIVGITMLPMEVAPLLLSLVAYYKTRKSYPESRTMWIVVNLSNILILISFLVYFLPVNLSFVEHSIAPGAVAAELKRWQLIHIARTILSVLSIVLAIRIHTSQAKKTYV